jgi:hypothetical protein
MTTAIFSQIERGVTGLGPMSKLAKFTSTSAETITKLFHGSDLARAIGSVGKPLKQFADFTDLTSFIDPLNGLFASSIAKQWSANKLKLIAKVALIAGLLLTPVGFLSSTLGLFSLGALGTNVATYGTLSGLNALKNGLILSSVLHTIYERNTAAGAITKNKEERAVWRTLNLKLMYESLQDRQIDRFKLLARNVDKTDDQIEQIYQKFQEKRLVSLAVPIRHARLLNNVEKYNAEKNAWGVIDDINKVALLTISFVGAFVSAAVPTLAVVSALQLYSAYVGWKKSDAEVLANKEKIAVFESLRDNHDQLKDWLVV